MRAIVLSGGGSKGSYEIGVWKAIRKLNIKYDIVTGTSVGALNGALMTQKNYLKAKWLWNNLTFEKVIDEQINIENYNDVAKKYFKNILKGGMTISNLESTIDKAINIKRIYGSNIKFGLVTVNFPSLKSEELTKEDIDPKYFKDYLVASASCFPAFKPKEINGKLYIDGGYYDNLPINLAIDLGATEIIAVDLKEVGFKRKVKSDIDITYITPRNKLGAFLIFSKEDARRGIRLGYNDTMKIYKRLDGNLYTFRYNHLEKNYNKYKVKFKNNLNDILKVDDIKLYQKFVNILILKKLISSKNFKKEFNKIIEDLGHTLNIDDSYIYDIRKYNKLIIKEFNKINEEDNYIEKHIKENKFKILINNVLTVKYIYKLLIQNKYRRVQNMILFFPNEFLMALYIYTIKEDEQ